MTAPVLVMTAAARISAYQLAHELAAGAIVLQQQCLRGMGWAYWAEALHAALLSIQTSVVTIVPCMACKLHTHQLLTSTVSWRMQRHMLLGSHIAAAPKTSTSQGCCATSSKNNKGTMQLQSIEHSSAAGAGRS